MGSRSKSGAAPATVVEFKSQRETTGPNAWEGVAMSPQGQLQSPETSPRWLNSTDRGGRSRGG
ncbi:hypothetical protein MESS4_120017 [Mesorhizobium sp. STM 4661]|nr:hypothetical protein MESS4_120017 [Mesorhizobium sp. STM 4661]